MLIDAVFQCEACWGENHIEVDPSGGLEQQYVEDCQHCCRPNLLRITLDLHAGEAWVEAELE